MTVGDFYDELTAKLASGEINRMDELFAESDDDDDPDDRIMANG